MLRRSAMVLLLTATLFALVGFAHADGPLRPGDHVGSMRLVRGTAASADVKLFDICDPVILRSGQYRRRCGRVPRTKRLFVGYGTFAAPRAIDRVWEQVVWSAWLDGRRFQLNAFGTSDRPLYAFPPAGFKDVTLREWRVMVVNAAPGRHTLRYRGQDATGVLDATWTFTVAPT